MCIPLMLTALKPYLPQSMPRLPAPSISIAALRERTAGIGNRLGNGNRGAFEALALHGLWLDAVLRFQVWADQYGAALTAITALQSSLLDARAALRGVGFLRISAVGVAPAEQVSSPSGWRASADMQVLYECRFQDADGAESLIAQIPVNFAGLPGQSLVVTDELARWDQHAAPALQARCAPGQQRRIGALAVLAYLPAGWVGGAVTLSVTLGGHTQSHVYRSIVAFLDACAVDAGTVPLGGNPYESAQLGFPNPTFPNPLVLTEPADVVSVSYATPQFNSAAVLYLRLSPA
jgi:hypothetical protein